MADEDGNPILDEDGKTKHSPFDNYSMKQAIQEGFILDVLKHYTPIKSYYKLIKTIEDDPNFDKKKAQKKLRKYVESDDYPISVKAEMIVDHFHEQVIAKQKIDGKYRAMVVTAGIERAIAYYHAINKCLDERRSPYKSIVAFSGEKEYEGKKVTESSLNGFPGSAIEKTFRKDPYRFLIVADKYIRPVEPVPTSNGGGKREAELDLLSSILDTFNDMWGGINWEYPDKARKDAVFSIVQVSKDKTYQNAMKNNDKQEARTESDRVLRDVIYKLMSDNMELFKQANGNPEFWKWLSDKAFEATYNPEGKPIDEKRLGGLLEH